jgi:16S rRNA (guanine527-N7)-methyltransferase
MPDTSPFLLALREASAEAGLCISDAQAEKMYGFYTMLEEANRSFNLTAIKGPSEAALRHFIDSLALPALALLRPGWRVIDVGTGAGFPGIPIAIMREDLQFTLLDSSNKKTHFLETAISALLLKNVTVVTARAEDHARGDGREAFDAALSRALAPMNVLLEYTLPFVRIGGYALAWKGPSAAVENSSSAHACRILGGDGMALSPYTLPGYGTFNIVSTRKFRATPTNYPRKAGSPSKTPII